MSPMPEYYAWTNMRQRCLNPTRPEYERYGGRGISICERWLESFDYFLEDMGHRPSDDLSLDRKNNSLGYSKDNCKWERKSIQSFNQRLSSDNRSGIVGVYREKQTGMWKAYIRVSGKQFTLGRFYDFFEACCTRKSSELKYYKEVVFAND